jgi:hypothetical protein
LLREEREFAAAQTEEETVPQEFQGKRASSSASFAGLPCKNTAAIHRARRVVSENKHGATRKTKEGTLGKKKTGDGAATTEPSSSSFRMDWQARIEH